MIDQMRTAALLSAIACIAPIDAAWAGTSGIMPASFEAGLVFLDLPSPDHSKVHMFTVSGSSALTLSSDAADRLNLQQRVTTNDALLMGYGPNVRIVNANAYMLRRWPEVRAVDSFVVVPGVVAFKGWPAAADGTLGTAWLARHTWTWDYPQRRLTSRSKTWRPGAGARAVAITFQTDARGRRLFDFARLPIQVDGVEISMLFDTGASTVLTPAALQSLNDGKPALRSASMIAHSVFEAWHLRHPGWIIVADAELSTHSRMILVPNVDIAGFSTGPVWFTERKTLSSTTSSLSEGSVGGNTLATLAISVDYPRSKAWVQQRPIASD